MTSYNFSGVESIASFCHSRSQELNIGRPDAWQLIWTGKYPSLHSGKTASVIGEKLGNLIHGQVGHYGNIGSGKVQLALSSHIGKGGVQTLHRRVN